jgi:Lrp/AsnC family leucine-responsive transcriptional regulator
VLEELLHDPRLTMSELGRRVGMSSAAVTERVRRLEETGVIRGYPLELDPVALGLPIAAYVRIRPNPGQLPRVAELAQQIPEVVECHRVTGENSPWNGWLHMITQLKISLRIPWAMPARPD